MRLRAVCRSALVVVWMACTLDARADGATDAAVVLGMTPEVLAAAGFTPVQVDAMLTGLREHPEQLAAFVDANAQRDTCTRSLSLLTEQLRVAPTDTELRGSVDNARQQLDLAEGGLRACKQQTEAIALEGVSAPDRARLTACRGGAKHLVPVSFWVLTASTSEWFKLERALNAERRAARNQGVVPPAEAGLLAEMRSRPEVVQAQAAFDANVEDIRLRFAQ